MIRPRLTCVSATALLVVVCATALAQDYTVTNTSGLFQARPPASTQIALTNTQTRQVALPFTFPYYGSGYSSLFVCSEGYVQLGVSSSTATPANAVFPRSGVTEGIIAPYWDDLSLNVSGQVWHWTLGTAPNREWICAWENVSVAASTTSRIWFQVHLYEDSGRIEFAYRPNTSPSTWLASSYTPGIDAIGTTDLRFVTPAGMNVLTNTGHPPADYRFDPTVRNYTGQLLYDRVASDATGVGNGVFSNLPLARVRVELRAPNGTLAGAGTTNATGDFTVKGVALFSSNVGTLAAVAESAAAKVTQSPGGVAYARTIASNVAFSSARAFGTLSMTKASDPNDDFLPAFHIATVLGTTVASAAAVTSTPIPQVEVVYVRGSSLPTSFTGPIAPSAAIMRIGGASSPNPDAWDTDVIVKTWCAGQFLGSLAAYSTASYNSGFDVISSPENAFAEGFGHYARMLLTGNSTFVDATGPSNATVWDLENPSLGTRKGPDVAGWVAAALCDVIDSANEFHDLLDGSGTAARLAVTVADALSTPVTADTFHAAWGAQGNPGAPLTRDFVHHGLLADDASELNNASGEAAMLGPAGFRRPAMVLNRFDEDWFEVTLAEPTDAFGADIEYDMAAIAAQVSLEIRTPAGALLATGSTAGLVNAISAVTAPVSAGTYRVRVTHVNGARVPAYALQIYAKLGVTLAFPPGWTVNHTFSSAAPIFGGVPPFTFLVQQPFVKPGGLILDADGQVIRGIPTSVGTSGFLITVRDGGSPQHEGGGIVQSFEVHPELAFGFREFVGVPLGRSVDVVLSRTGGTEPFDFTFTGVTPAGTTLSPDGLRLEGTAADFGVTHVDVSGSDRAGSKAQGSTSFVVCAPSEGGAAAMHVDFGVASCGCFFDALAGSTVSAAVKTLRGKAKRGLTPVVVAADGAVVASGKFASGVGRAGVAGAVCPETGRYFLVLAADAGEVSDVSASLKISPPKKGKGGEPDFAPSDVIDVPVGALAGATLSFKASGDKSSRLDVIALALLDPSGAAVPLAGLVTETSSGFSLSATLPAAGTWRVRIGARSGPSGTMSWSFSIRQPHGVVFTLP